MDGKTLARIGAVAFAGAAIAATAVEMNRPADRQDDQAPQARPAVKRDPLRAELARCSQLGEAGARDLACLRIWAENRRRFLGQPAPAISSAPDTPSDSFPNASPPAAEAETGTGPNTATPNRNGNR